MYLKRLELGGFKTFADRTELEFHSGITAIVGPNGSGKSNISDAVRWVLGEQSARSLRAGRMEDVIFAGSEDRRGYGLAQVTITLDNTDGALPLEFAEVSVTRRATRGGEGEYLLNGVPCRLRDIQMLFLGTGLGGRSYALIGQGEVDAVLNASNQERRLWLEEAAGLARIKRRRHESLRRLDHAAAHLARLGDLLGELRFQHGRLTEQAEAARLHVAYTEEIRSLELAFVAEEGRRLASTRRRHHTQMGTLHSRLDELQAAGADARRRLDEALRTREAIARRRDEMHEHLLTLARRQAAAQSAVERSEQQRDAHSRAEERLQEEMARAGTEIARLCTDLAAVRRERASSERAAETAAEEWSIHTAVGAAEDEGRVTLRHDLGAQEARRAGLLEARQDLARREATAQARVAMLKTQRAGLADRRSRLEIQTAQAASEEAQLVQRLRDTQQAADERHRRRVEAADGVRIAEEELRAAGDEIAAAQASEHRLESRLQALEEASRVFAGYEEGARKLLAARGHDRRHLGGIVGALVDQIEVAPEYRPAVAASLGPRLFCLLTRELSDVREALRFLRNNGGEAASFFPLDHSNGTRPASETPSLDGVLGPASRFVSSSDHVRAAVEAILEDVVIVRDLETGLRCREAGFAGRSVTLLGEVVSPDGMIAVGARGSNGRHGHGTDGDGSPLGRRADLDAARRKLDENGSTIVRLRARAQTLEDRLRAARADLAIAEAEHGRLERESGELEAALRALGRERGRLPHEVEEVATESSTVEHALSSADEERVQLAAEGVALDGSLREVEQQIAGAQQTLEEWEAMVARHRRRADDLRVRLAEVEALGRGLLAREQDLSRSRDEVSGRRALLAGERVRLALRRAEVDGAVTAARDARVQMDAEDAAARQTLEALKEERSTADEAQSRAEADVARIGQDVRDTEAAIHRQEMRGVQADTEWAALERRLRNDFAASWEAVEEIRLPVSRDEATGRLEALRGMIAAMGAVNLRAIEEQESLTRRIDTLAAHVEDLERARAALLALVSHLDSVLRVRFRDTFEAVSKEFNRLFVRLFEGGDAHLELIRDEEHPEAEPGVEVVVRIPGKKPRALAALSGGERVLVALAILFAMLRVNPSPFCVFDEVEAALDDGNTRRFTNLLRELAESTQVMIITHNKGTMEAADVLYGVTMQEPGVSSVLSVRLGERSPHTSAVA